MDVQVALDKLAGLGSADAIAKFLEEEGIRGNQCASFSCPVSEWLNSKCGIDGTSVGVNEVCV